MKHRKAPECDGCGLTLGQGEEAMLGYWTGFGRYGDARRVLQVSVIHTNRHCPVMAQKKFGLPPIISDIGVSRFAKGSRDRVDLARFLEFVQRASWTPAQLSRLASVYEWACEQDYRPYLEALDLRARAYFEEELHDSQDC